MAGTSPGTTWGEICAGNSSEVRAAEHLTIPIRDQLRVDPAIDDEHALRTIGDPVLHGIEIGERPHNNAIGAMATAAARGLVIPDDLSIIGYNDIPVVSKLPVPLTTIREPFNLIARGAIDLLLDETPNHTGEIPTIVATPTLIPRQSTAAPRSR